MLQYLIGLVIVVSAAFGLIQEDIIPPLLQDCYSRHEHLMTTSNEYVIQTDCLHTFLNTTFGTKTFLTLDETALKWFDSLGMKTHRILKRQAPKRRRREIRTLSNYERRAFFNAINALKRDKSVTPNKYDAFALMHQTLALPSAHGGPNFVSWHRYYLELFESALREKNIRVTLPYWASNLEHEMDDPTQSVFFTSMFVGNGVGRVIYGPFANWTTPAGGYLQRNIGAERSSLINATALRNVFLKRYNREILSPTATRNIENLERHHDSVHVWVGGHMSGTPTSPQDPIFFLHHCYIDYLWKSFGKDSYNWE